jgi:uncharacterized membrane protein YhaH (DUF805 family)
MCTTGSAFLGKIYAITWMGRPCAQIYKSERQPVNTIEFLFGMKSRVKRQEYLFWGLGLLLVKYLGELALYFAAKEKVLTPFNFLSPLLSARYPGSSSLPDWFLPVMLLWSLPFIWIGVGMSIRRAMDANLTPWLGLLFFVPGLNYLLMICLSCIPTSQADTWNAEKSNRDVKTLFSPLVLALLFAICGALMVWYSTNFLKTYGTSLFVGSPLILGLVLGYFLNSKAQQSLKKSAGYVGLTILLIHLFLLLFALEGVICLAMSLPLSLALATMGSMFGAAIAKYSKPNAVSPSLLLFALPILPWAESAFMSPHQDSVLSSIVIDAPATQVWPHVIKFSDLPKTDDWLFKLGVAHPLRARIEGQGEGAIRHCEFSTGSFVEPITTWNEPHHLAFDVKYQPQPMKELTFYDHLDAPHLDGYFRSVKGEFRLTQTSDGKTLLEGRTWYEMDMQPGWYWQMYGRWFIHRIHGQVLAHIKNLAETK